MSLRLKVLTTCAVALAAISVFVFWNTSEPTQERNARENSLGDVHFEVAADGSDEASSASSKQLPYDSKYGALVKSLKGIYFDRDLAVDDEGNLRVSSDIKDIFDFFFSAIEEEDLDIVLARIDEYLRYKLQEPALSQALAVLHSYVEYKASVMDLELAFSDRIAEFVGSEKQPQMGGAYLSLVQERNEQVKLLRQDHLNAEIHEAFYGEREQYDDYMLKKLQINADASLNQQQKQAAQLLLDAQMPAEFIERRRAANPVAELRNLTQGDGFVEPNDLYQKRVSVVGEPAANRLARLDEERASWNSRYQAYSVQRDAVLNNSGLPRESQIEEVLSLRMRLFDDSERVRVAALDQINNAL